MFKHTPNSNKMAIYDYLNIFQTIAYVLSDWMVKVESGWD